MNVEQIRKWLACLGERTVEVGDTWANTHCPLAPWNHRGGVDRNPSFGVKIEPGDSQVWCFSCHFGGNQTELLITLSGLLKGEVHTLDIRAAMRMIVDAEEGMEARELWADEEESGPVEDYVFSEEWLDRFPLAYDLGSVHWYLAERGVPFEVAEALDLRYMHSEDRVCFPIRNWDGDLVGLHGRAVISEVSPRYRMIKYKGKKNPRAWLGEAWIDVEKPVVLVESVFDLARVYQVYRNVACPLVSGMSIQKVRRIERCEQLVVMMDPDDAGQHAERSIERELGDECAIRLIKLVDRDPGDMSVGEVAELLDGVVELDKALL